MERIGNLALNQHSFGLLCVFPWALSVLLEKGLSCVMTDGTFQSLRPYVLEIPHANESVPIAFGISPPKWASRTSASSIIFTSLWTRRRMTYRLCRPMARFGTVPLVRDRSQRRRSLKTKDQNQSDTQPFSLAIPLWNPPWTIARTLRLRKTETQLPALPVPRIGWQHNDYQLAVAAVKPVRRISGADPGAARTLPRDECS
jgi:hypothetical protein